MSRPILIKNARIVDPATNTDRRGAILIADGEIAGLTEGAPQGVPEGADTYDAKGLVVSPGLIDMREGLKGADVVMMLRLQHERAAGKLIPSIREYYRFYGLDAEKLALAKPDAIVMHPGPMNRGVEIDPAIADGPRSVINEQVEMGVAVRMAVLDALLADREVAA